MSAPVAVVDVGSNSIKLLVADLDEYRHLRVLLSTTDETRVGTGIGRDEPRLAEAGIAAALDAIQRLLRKAARFSPERLAIVATSAVRDAANGAELRERVRTATGGHDLRILSGTEEANLIGRGLAAEPALRGRRDFFVFDLGGGSLECLEFRERRVRQAASFPLGCVRLTERCVSDPGKAFGPRERRCIDDAVATALRGGEFNFDPSGTRPLVGTGGTVTVARAILAAQDRVTIDDTEARIATAELEAMLARLGSMPLAERRAVAGLPAARADVFPTGLATVLAVARHAGASHIVHSLYNLRYGLAAEMLGL